MGMKLFLTTLPDLLSQPVILWVTQLAVLQDFSWAVMLIFRMETKRRPANDSFTPIRIDEDSNFRVWGVVIYTIKKWK